MKTKYHSIADWNFSLWFALLSPVIGILLGILVSLVQPPSEQKAKELGVRAAFLGAHPNGEQLAEIAKIIDSGKLAPVIDRILPLSEVPRAHELSQTGHTHGKIVLRVKE